MKMLRPALALCIVAFWLVMNSVLVSRELEFRDLGVYRQGVVNFLGQDLHRERWLGIYRKHRKIGYSGIVFSKSFEDDGIRHEMRVDSKITLDLFGKGKSLRVNGTIVSDPEMVPELMEMEVAVDGAVIRLDGKRVGKSFVITGSSWGNPIFEFPLPLEPFYPTDGFFPSLPISGFEVGKTYEVPFFDPIFRSRTRATVTVIEQSVRTVDGLSVDCFTLQTRFRGVKYTSLVTPDGELIRQEIPAPFNVVLRRESRREAPRGILTKPGLDFRRPKTAGDTTPADDADSRRDRADTDK